MTIYEGESSVDTRDDWVEKEKIVLSDYKTKDEMHSLMVEKGFQLKSDEEIEAMKLQKQKQAAEEEELKAKKREETRKKREESTIIHRLWICHPPIKQENPSRDHTRPHPPTCAHPNRR